MDKRTIAINGKKRWVVNAMLDVGFTIPNNNGYFGAYRIIQYQGKKAVIYTDDRDAIINVITNWYDDIPKCDWDGDYRWNSDKPIVVIDGVYCYLIKPHSNELLVNEKFQYISSTWNYSANLKTYYCVGILSDGNECIILLNGIIRKKESLNVNPTELLNKVKGLSPSEIVNQWINKNLPCAHIHGLEYKGAKHKYICKEQAIELLKSHQTFNSYFPSAEWCLKDGQVILLFRDYCSSDYD